MSLLEYSQEGVLRITGWMLLGHEEGLEVPEIRFYEATCGHLIHISAEQRRDI
jgi:hypothetical protein